MSRTIELLDSLKNALLRGALPVSDFPLSDVKCAVEAELDVYKNTFLEKQYIEVKRRFGIMTNSLETNSKEGIVLYLNACILTLSMISEAVLSLINREYWELVHRDKLSDIHVQNIISYIDTYHQVKLIPYEFMSEYDTYEAYLQYDEKINMPYVMHGDRRMYFPSGWNEEGILSYYRTLLAEQDIRSPHCYQKEGFEVKQGDIVLDAGAAEGIFALNVLDKADKIYLVECDEMWLTCLKATFAKEIVSGKVILVEKYLSDTTDGSNITIDTIITGGMLNYIKMDIEGYEKEALKGATATLQKTDDMRMAVCSYHCEEDEIRIKNFLSEMGYKTTNSDGYMCPDWMSESILKAQLRRGVVFGKKTKKGCEKRRL